MGLEHDDGSGEGTGHGRVSEKESEHDAVSEKGIEHASKNATRLQGGALQCYR